jgi:hypothetical protein
MLLVTLIELSIANGWLVTSSPPDMLDDVHPNLSEERVVRIPPNRVHDWIVRQPPSSRRLDDFLVWEFSSLRERTYLEFGVNVADGGGGGLDPADLRQLWQGLGQGVIHTGVRRQLAIDLALPSSTVLGDQTDVRDKFGSPPKALPVPRAYLPASIQWVEPINERVPAQLKRRTDEYLMEGSGRPETAILERELEESEEAALAEFDLAGADISIVHDSPQRVDLVVQRPTAGLVVLADYYAPGWTAELVDLETGERLATPIYRANRVLRGVFVPAGGHRVEFRYRPKWFYVGFAVSGLAWSILALSVFCRGGLVLPRNAGRK